MAEGSNPRYQLIGGVDPRGELRGRGSSIPVKGCGRGFEPSMSILGEGRGFEPSIPVDKGSIPVQGCGAEGSNPRSVDRGCARGGVDPWLPSDPDHRPQGIP